MEYQERDLVVVTFYRIYLHIGYHSSSRKIQKHALLPRFEIREIYFVLLHIPNVDFFQAGAVAILCERVRNVL